MLRLSSPAIAMEAEVEVRRMRAKPLEIFGNDVHANSYITQLTLSCSDKTLAVPTSHGLVSLWERGDQSVWELDCIINSSIASGVVPLSSGNQRWCWDAAFVGEEDRFLLAACSDGVCKLWDVSRPSSPPIASYDCGGGKSVKSVVVLDSGGIDQDVASRRRK